MHASYHYWIISIITGLSAAAGVSDETSPAPATMIFSSSAVSFAGTRVSADCRNSGEAGSLVMLGRPVSPLNRSLQPL